ncbi:hypothetical protein SCA03_02860 [Streptomyces cacaoi]|uniref:Uncharacterized protein n=1 Tax=Streptomyces cacaoi TaxID=1898 RepID=A0A4Y3QR06_STRCI|nr:hypothetical protein SCA03_02860 [Streptomyces cacaoi]
MGGGPETEAGGARGAGGRRAAERAAGQRERGVSGHGAACSLSGTISPASVKLSSTPGRSKAS